MSNQYYSPQQPSYGYAVVPVSPDIVRGQQHAQTSMILGIISLVVGPIALILGPLAIVYAGKAEALRVPATAGKVTGWIGTILAVPWLIGIGIWLLLVFSVIGLSI